MGYPAVKFQDDAPYPLMADTVGNGDRVKKLLKERGIGQADFADALGISQGELSKKLNGKSPWTMPQWEKAAQLLKMTPRELLAPVTVKDKLAGRIVPVGLDKDQQRRAENACKRLGLTDVNGQPQMEMLLKQALNQFLAAHEAQFQVGKHDASASDDE